MNSLFGHPATQNLGDAFNQTAIRVVRALFLETGTYDQQYLRPYQTHVDSNIALRMGEVISNNGGKDVLIPGDIAGLATSILSPQAAPGAAVAMPNGYGVKRFRFLIEVEFLRGNTTTVKEIISGYTDTAGVSITGNRDQNMRMYFNNVFTVRTVTDPSGRVMSNVEETSQVLTSPPILGQVQSMGLDPFSPNGNGMIYTQSPQDVMDMLSTESLGSVINESVGFRINRVKKSNRGNTVPSMFLSKAISGIWQGHKTKDAGDNDYMQVFAHETNTYDHAKSIVREASITSDTVFSRIWLETSYPKTSSVSYNELCSIMTGLDQVAEFRISGGVQSRNVVQAGMGASWQSSTSESVVATTVAQAIPSIMMQNFIHRIHFVATNISGQLVIGPVEATDVPLALFNVPNFQNYIQRFIDRAIIELFSPLSHNNQVQLTVRVNCNVLGDTLVSVTYAGGPTIDYFAPTFADHLISPVLTDNYGSLHKLASDIGNLAGIGMSNTNPYATAMGGTSFATYTPPQQTNGVF